MSKPVQPTQALVEIRRWTHDTSVPGMKRLQQRELTVVPFSYGPRCWVKAIKAAGAAPVRMNYGGSFDNHASGAKNWTSGYVLPINAKSNAEKAIKDRIKFIQEQGRFMGVTHSKMKDGVPLVILENKEI